jgi:hypothetical protein
MVTTSDILQAAPQAVGGRARQPLSRAMARSVAWHPSANAVCTDTELGPFSRYQMELGQDERTLPSFLLSLCLECSYVVGTRSLNTHLNPYTYGPNKVFLHGLKQLKMQRIYVIVLNECVPASAPEGSKSIARVNVEWCRSRWDSGRKKMLEIGSS